MTTMMPLMTTVRILAMMSNERDETDEEMGDDDEGDSARGKGQ